MLIAEAAARIGVPTHRLRHYEATSLLIPDRGPSGYRDYSDGDIARGRQIRALLDSGFTARDVALMLPCMIPEDDDRRGCPVTTARLIRRLEVISERRAQLEATEQALTAWLANTIS